jgi:hypothetical protein
MLTQNLGRHDNRDAFFSALPLLGGRLLDLDALGLICARNVVCRQYGPPFRAIITGLWCWVNGPLSVGRLHAQCCASPIRIGGKLNAEKSGMTPDQSFFGKEIVGIGFAAAAVQRHEQCVCLARRAWHTDAIASATGITGPVEVVALACLRVAPHGLGRRAIVGALASDLPVPVNASTTLRVTLGALLAEHTGAGSRNTAKVFSAGKLRRTISIFQTCHTAAAQADGLAPTSGAIDISNALTGLAIGAEIIA